MRSGTTSGDHSAQTPAVTAPNIAGLLPAVPYALTDGSVTGLLPPERAIMQYHGKESIATLGLGFGYFRPLFSKRTCRCLLNRFPYGVLYRVDIDAIRVGAVMHLNRDPKNWRLRTGKF